MNKENAYLLTYLTTMIFYWVSETDVTDNFNNATEPRFDLLRRLTVSV